jgi:hypothetical protein
MTVAPARARYNGRPSQINRVGATVKFKGLLDEWQKNAGPARTATEYAVRLPVDDAARIQALVDLFPGQTRETVITDLLGLALQEISAAMPYVAGKKVISQDDQGDPVYEDVGLTPRFMDLTRKHKKKLAGSG